MNDTDIINEFVKHYPDIDPSKLDEDLLIDMVNEIMIMDSNFLKNKALTKNSDPDKINITNKINKMDKINKTDKTNIKDNFYDESDILTEYNYMMANELIPEMLVPSDLIRLNGKLNGVEINILIDSGAQTSTTFKSITDKSNLDHIIDKKIESYSIGVNGVSRSYGIIWYIELELELDSKLNNYVGVPIKLSVDDDTEKIKKLQELNTNSELKYENKIDMLLGIDFLKAYKAKIDFGKRTIILNDSITINYKSFS